MTQYKLGAVTGIPHSTISRMALARTPNPKMTTMMQIAWGLGLTAGEFFTDPLFDEGNLNF